MGDILLLSPHPPSSGRMGRGILAAFVPLRGMGGSYLSLRNAGQSRRSGVEVEPRPVLHQRHITLAQLAHVKADEAVEKLIF